MIDKVSKSWAVDGTGPPTALVHAYSRAAVERA